MEEDNIGTERKIENNSRSTFPLIQIIGFVIFIFLNTVYSIFTGLAEINAWAFGLGFLVFLFVVNRFTKKLLKNITLYLTFVFLAFYFIPTIEYYLYISNKNFYVPSENFLTSESILAQEKLEGKLKANDWDKILVALKSNKYPESANKKSSFSLIDTLYVPELITVRNEKGFAINMGKRIYTFKKDSLQTELILKFDGPLPFDSEFVKMIESERNEQRRLQDIRDKKRTTIPYSEFVIEAITSFSSQQISLNRNVVKVLNGIEILLIIILTTMTINSIGTELKVYRIK